MKRGITLLGASVLTASFLVNTPAFSATDDEALKQAVEAVLREHRSWDNAESAVHLGGYASVLFADGDGKMHGMVEQQSGFNTVLYAPIFHYQMSDRILLEAELNIEVDGEETDVEMEYLTIDWIVNDYATLLVGKFLSPTGQFVQNLHPAWINKLPTMPIGFGHDGAAPTSDLGIQLRGGFDSGIGINYAVYVANGPELVLEKERGAGGDLEAFAIHGIESGGSTHNEDREFVFGGRLGVLPMPNLEIGFSYITGKVGIELADDDIDGTGTGLAGEESKKPNYSVFGIDASYRRGGLKLNGEYVKTEIDRFELTDSNFVANGVEVESEPFEAWYVQAAYRFNSGVEPVIRYGAQDVLETGNDAKEYVLGVNYYIAENAVAKLAYESQDWKDGDDTSRVLLQLAYGF